MTPVEKADIEQTVRILIGIPYAVKNHLRAEWGAAWEPISRKDIDGTTAAGNRDHLPLAPKPKISLKRAGVGLLRVEGREEKERQPVFERSSDKMVRYKCR